jgi:Tfp pilus assembly protein PilF
MKRERKANIIFLVTLFILGLILRLIYLWQYAQSPLFEHITGPDSSEYVQCARRIISGMFIWDKVGIHAPLYPYMLAGLYMVSGSDIFWIRLIQLLLSMLAFYPLFPLVKRLAGSNGVMRYMPYFFLTIAVCYPPLMFYMGETISEALLIPLVTISVFMLYRADTATGIKKCILWYGAAGLTLGAAVITHPLSLFFVMLEGLYLAWRLWRGRKRFLRRGLVSLVVFGVAAGIFIIPVSMYNTYLHGSLVLVQTNSGYNMYLGNNPDATGGCYIWPGPKWNKVHGDASAAAVKLGISKDKYFFKQTLKFITESPLQWLRLLWSKALYVWNFRELTAGPDLPALKYYTAIQSSTSWIFGMVGTLALCGMFCGAARVKTLLRYRHFYLLVLATWVGLTLTVVSGRYRLIFAAGIFIFTAYALCLLVDRLRHGKFFSLPMLLLPLSAGIVFIPVPQVNYQEEQAHAYTILGEAALSAGDKQTARRYLELALEFLSDWSRSYNIIGKLLNDDDPKEAAVYFRKAIEVDPTCPYAYMNLAGQFSDANNIPEARRYYELALKYGANDPQVLYNYGYFLFRRNDFVQAAQYLERCLRERPDQREAINTLAVIRLLTNNYAESVHLFGRAIRLDPENDRLKVNYAAALLAAGRKNEAIRCLNEILARKPEFPPAKALMRTARQP